MKTPIGMGKIEPKSPVLKKVIKNFWLLTSSAPVEINHKLLPVTNLDFVIDLTGNCTIYDDSDVLRPKGFFYTGIRNKHYIQKQNSRLKIFGISFYPLGAYPFLKRPVRDFKGNFVEVDSVIENFSDKVQRILVNSSSINIKIKKIEDELLKVLDLSLIASDRDTFLLNTLMLNRDNKLKDFCSYYGVSERRVERLFNRYIGAAPKEILKISRFRRALFLMLNSCQKDLTTLGQNSNYYDQSHFIRDFKVFTGLSPNRFIKEKRSISEILIKVE